MNNYTCEVQTFYVGKWVRVLTETQGFCYGYVSRVTDSAPRNAYRILRSDGRLIQAYPAVEDVSIGLIAGQPTAEQYESAAHRALEKAAQIRATDARHQTT